MKKIFIAALFCLFATMAANAQRYAVIDSKYILDKIPEYKEAQTRLDQFSDLWQKEIEQKQAAVDKMYKDYDAEQVMLPDNLKKKEKTKFIIKKKNSGTCSGNALALRETCLRKDRS